MIEKKVKKSSFLRLILILGISLFVYGNSHADTYYWRLTGGAPDWGNLGRWAAFPGGPGNAYLSAPSSDDDVFIDATGIAAGNSTINFTNSSAVQNLTITGCPVAPTFVMSNTLTFDIWGNATFQASMNLSNFLGTMRFISTDLSLAKVIETNGNSFFGRWEYAVGNNLSTASVTINGNFTLRHSFLINSTLATDHVIITGNTTFAAAAAFNPMGAAPGSNLHVVKGEVYFNGPFTATTNNYQFYIQPTGKLFSRANGSVTAIYNSGLVNLNYAGTNPTYYINDLDIYAASSSPALPSPLNFTTASVTGSIFNFANTEINVLNIWHYGRGTSSFYSIVSNGSHLRFGPNSTTFYTQNYTYNDVTIEPSTVAGYFVMNGSNTISTITPSFDDFVIRRNTNYSMQGTPVSFTFTSNTYKIHPGLTVANQFAVGRIAVNSICDITGTCQLPIRLTNMNFQFFGATTVSADYLYTEGITATGPSTPYNAGSSSRVITGVSTGWNFSTALGRTLIWIAPLPSNISDPNTFGNWSDPNNWRDVAIDPGASAVGPGFVGGTPACPPTFRDSVVFLNNSYVDVDVAHFIYSSGVNFVGTGTINGPANLEWEIYAGLTFSTNTTNNFLGTVWFRNDKTYECSIATRNVPFRKGVIMNAINAAGNWRLTDGDLIALTSDPLCMTNWVGTSRTISLRMARGHLHTGITNCSSVGSFKMRLYGLGASGGTMSWYGSDIEMLGAGSVYEIQNAAVLNCGISHLKCDFFSSTPGLTQSVSLGNKTYYRVSLLSSAGVSTQPSHNLDIQAQTIGVSPVIVDLFAHANTLPSAIHMLGSAATPVKIRKLVSNAPVSYLGLNWCPGCGGIGTIDTLILNGDAFIHQDLRIRSYMQLTAGKNYVFGTTSRYIDLMGASSDGSYSTCVSLPTSYTGATTTMNGSCSALIRIENGMFIKNSPHAINAQYLNIVNNTIQAPGTGLNSNGVLTGTTTGWSITPTIPRKLRWVDTSPVVGNAPNWNDASKWEQILPSYAPAPQCPPTKVDTVVFDNGSFAALNQRFAVNTPLEVASMYWNNIPGPAAPGTTCGISGSATVSIFGSILLPNVNQTNFMASSTSSFEFRGIPTPQFPTFTIRTNGHRYRSNLLFLSASDLARWDLQDSLALYGHFTLNRGRFYTNGFPMYSQQGGFAITALNSTDLRTMDITNSKIYATLSAIAGGYWRVTNLGASTNTTINASGSWIQVTMNPGGNTVFNGGGYVYNDVVMITGAGSAPCVMNITNGDRFGFIDIKPGGPATIQGGPNMIAERIRSNSSNFILSSTRSIIDTVELLAGVSTFSSSNRIRKMLDVASNTTWNIGANEVQWFDNDCPVNLIGLSTSNYIQLFSTNLGTPAYLRKDSATVCADYIKMRDIWCVGNGNNPASGCTSFGSPVANTLCPTANIWIPSACDTISDDGTLCGSWAVTDPTRGRAAFTAGAEATNQGLSCRGWDYRPYPPVPSIQLASATPSICVGQSVTLTLTGVGKIPFYMDYTDNFGNTYPINITNSGQLVSYNATTNAFTYQTTVSPAVSTTYSAGVIAIERCFNNTSPIGTGSVAITVNQYPQINNAVLSSSACSGASVTITPSTSIPATVNWTSPNYVGVTGHGNSGSSTINETLSNSNTTPVDVVYTLTPTANGCTGTPVDYTFTVNPLPTNTAGPTQTLDCNTSSVVVTANSSTPGVNYSWSGPSILSGGSTDAATVSAVGTYTCVVTNPTTGCTRTSNVLVNFAPDITIPTITCPLNITTNTSSSTCNASVNVPNPVINDNCVVSILRWSMSGATVASSPLTGINNIGTQNFNLGTTTVTYTVIDASNNQTTCSFTVTVTDNVNPIITCPGNIATTTTAVACSRSVSVPNPTISDNCTINSLTWSMSGATTGNSPATGINNIGTQTFNLGVTTVSYTLVDQSGNSSTCNFTVTVTDATNPVINCPANVNVFTSTSSCTASVVTTNPIISDNCTIASLTWAITGATTGNSSATGINNLGTNTFNLGVSTVIYTITDGSGNQSTCSFTVTVTDNVNPVITCPASISAFTSSGSCTASVLNPNPTVSDNCSLSTLTYTITGATTANSLAIGINNVGTQVFNLGVSTVTYTATDAAGNSSTCSYTVTVTDNVNPTINCPSNISVNTSSSSCDASVNVPNVVFGDNCSVAALSWVMSGATVGASSTTGINQVGTQIFNSGVTTIVYTVRDASNNQTTCSFTITVTDATPPVAPTLPDVTGQCAATVPIPVATDNCSGFVNGTTSDPLTYSSQGTFTVNWSFTDAAGNTTLATQTVIIDNNLPPTPPVLATLVGECSVTVPVPSATTGCSGPVLGTTSDPLIYTTQGTYTVTWTFDDGIGNVVSAPQTVIVDDITLPVVPVVSNITSECSATLTAPTTTDNCVGTVTGTTTDPTVYTNQGTYNITWTFNDGNGNSSAVIQTVTIQDVTPPVLNGCPSTITQNNDPGQCDAVVSWTPPVATDNCVGFVLTSSHNPGDVFPLGTTTVTYTLTDVGGNSVSCSFDVTVNENEAPIINNCPSNINTGNSIGQCGAIVDWTLPTATDNCPGVVLTSTHNSGDFFNLGTTTVTYTATDANGNSATCTFDITVTDTENPVLIGCPSDVITGNTIGVCEAAVSWTAPTASDNCPTTTVTSNYNPGAIFPVGTTLVTYTVTDGAGNTATCSFNVTVEDQEAPTISGLSDISVCEGGQVIWNEVITDNCSGVTYTSNYSSGTVFELGNTTVTYIATDAAGNTTTVSFTVNVYELTTLQLEITPNTEICAGDLASITVLNPPVGSTYEWTYNGVVVGTNPVLDLTNTSPTMNGTYLLTVTQPGGCLSYGNANLFIDYCDIKIPEAVTPNGDLINDTWSIENLENYPNSSVQIVNRWGSIVFESDDYKNDWDGTSYNDLNVGGNQLPEGTFFYVLKLGGDPSSKLYGKVYTGYIYLKR